MEYPYLQLWINDWRNDIDIKTMTLEQEGLLFRIIQELWEHDKLPNDEKKLAVFCRLNIKTFRRLWPFIADKLTIENGFISHKRVDEEKNKLRSKSKINRKNGKNGGLAKANARKTLQRNPSIPEPESESYKGPVPSDSKEQGTGPENTKKDTKNSQKLGLSIAKTIEAHEDALKPEASDESPKVQKLLYALLNLTELAAEPERLLAYILQARRREGLRCRVSFCIKLVKNPDHQVADNCLVDAKAIVRSWAGKIDDRVAGILPDLGVEK